MLLLFVLACLAVVSASAFDHRASHRQIRKRGCARRHDPAVSLASPSATTSTSQSAESTTALEQNPVLGVVAPGGSGFNYGTDKIRGVNLGGWLVLESFVTPSIFSNTGNDGIVDEWTFCQYQDRGAAESALRSHWEAFITEDDFKRIAAAGLNHVRIPVGYWAWDVQGDEPFVQGSAEFLDKAIGWARNNGLKVLIDLHGAPGSQNGYDHSGRKGNAEWHTNPANVQRTIDLIKRLSAQYGSPEYSDTVTMFQLLNEPTLWLNEDIQRVTKQFYIDAYEVARRPWGGGQAGNRTDWVIVFHDGFEGMGWWSGVMSGDEYEGVWIDHHSYQAFGDEFMGLSAEGHMRKVCDQRANYESSPFPTITGEWSLGLWACAPAEGNTGMGDVGTCSEFDQRYDTFMRAFFDVQVQLFEQVGKGQGWFFFNWKMEQGIAEWSWQTMKGRNGWAPEHLGEVKFDLGTICAGA